MTICSSLLVTSLLLAKITNRSDVNRSDDRSRSLGIDVTWEMTSMLFEVTVTSPIDKQMVRAIINFLKWFKCLLIFHSENVTTLARSSRNGSNSLQKLVCRKLSTQLKFHVPKTYPKNCCLRPILATFIASGTSSFTWVFTKQKS